MRMPILALTVVLGLFAWSAVPADVVAASSAIAGSADVAQQQPPTDIDVDIGQEGGGAWYTSPTWIAIGAIALVVIVLLIVMAGRGGGTTIVRD